MTVVRDLGRVVPVGGDPVPEVPADLAALGRRLDREVRRDAAEGEREAQLLRLRQRTLVDAAWDHMQRGDVVAVSWWGGRVAGAVTAAVGDLVVVDGDGWSVGVNAARVGRIGCEEPAAGSPAVGDRSVGSWQAWLRAVEGAPVRVFVVGEELPVAGVVVAAARDHLLVRSPVGVESAVGLSVVAAVGVAGDGPSVMR